jgi:hypothetical protein
MQLVAPVAFWNVPAVATNKSGQSKQAEGQAHRQGPGLQGSGRGDPGWLVKVPTGFVTHVV